MKIGLHGRNHVDWSKLDKKELTDEIITAKNELEDILGNPVEDAACPYGKYNRVVLKTLKKAKYKHIYTSDKGITSNKNWLISRNSVHNNENVEMYKNRIREELKIISIQKSIKFVKKLIKRYR